MHVALIGGAGLVGKKLAEKLCQQGHHVRVLDVVPFSLVLPNTSQRVHSELVDLCRVQQSSLARLLQGCDALVHLAAQINPPRRGGRAAMRLLHERGTQITMRAAKQAEIPRVVLVSSAVVYGAHDDNPDFISEDHALRPLADFPYGLDKKLQEDIFNDEKSSWQSAATLRSAIIFSKQTDNYLSHMLRIAPGILPAVDGKRPALQFVHTDDVAEALATLATGKPKGAFNFGGAPSPYDEVARIAGLKVVNIPRRALAPFLNVGARFVPAKWRAPAYVLDQLAHPYVLSSKRAESELGVVARSSAEALADMLQR
ncbi:MAG: NAD-dependent epimerase/dehydratase family protein [Deltaproteobacteria bacterium]|nr:NAD-dependent epimerase/dehydratase family protein [Deltaproteobacteria bacterium]